MDNEIVLSMECPCGNVFEPEKEEVDASGDRYVRCPKCDTKIPVTEVR